MKNKSKWSPIRLHTKETKKKKSLTQEKKKEERKRTPYICVYSKNESKTRPTQLARLQKKKKRSIYFMYSTFSLPGMIKEVLKKESHRIFSANQLEERKKSLTIIQISHVRKTN